MDASLLIFTTKYSRICVFCNAWLSVNKSAIVMTAGLDNPDMASSGVKKPNPNRILKMSKAVMSKLKVSVTNRIKANPMMARTNAISNVI
jgi:hypothetical protein